MADTEYTVHDRENKAYRQMKAVDNGDGTFSQSVSNPPGTNLDVLLGDQTTDSFDFYFTRKINLSSLAAEGAIGATSITLAVGHGAVAGDMVSIFSVTTARGYVGQITNVNVNVVTLDTPLDSTFFSASPVRINDKNLGSPSANGTLATPVVYSIDAPEVGKQFDVVRIMWQMVCASAVDLTKFGDLSTLTNGLVLRLNRQSGTEYLNLMNVKNNAEIQLHGYDFDVSAATNPQQGIDGLAARMTWGGQNKRGVVLRLDGGDALEALVQDDLRGLTTFYLMAEGHVVDNGS